MRMTFTYWWKVVLDQFLHQFHWANIYFRTKKIPKKCSDLILNLFTRFDGTLTLIGKFLVHEVSRFLEKSSRPLNVDEFSSYQSSSWLGNWNFETNWGIFWIRSDPENLNLREIFGWVFQDLPILVNIVKTGRLTWFRTKYVMKWYVWKKHKWFSILGFWKWIIPSLSQSFRIPRLSCSAQQLNEFRLWNQNSFGVNFQKAISIRFYGVSHDIHMKIWTYCSSNVTEFSNNRFKSRRNPFSNR